MESKLYELKVEKSKHGDVISLLIENNYLNEERFAREFAGGKFRMKQWGRKKIAYELKGKAVSEYCIKKAIKTIDNTEYLTTIEKLVKKKMNSLKGDTFAMKKKKTVEYMMGKGFETGLVLEVIGDAPKKKAK